MDYMAKINDLKNEKTSLLEQADGLIAAGKWADAEALQEQIRGLNTSISTLEAQAGLSAQNADPQTPPEGDPTPAPQAECRPFASLGEQLKSIYNMQANHVEDKRLREVNAAVLGGNEGTGADGGFAIQTDFAGQILATAMQRSHLLPRLDRYTVSANSNSARWLMIDETDVSSSVFGGVQMYWASEGSTVAASRPKFREMKLDLEKMMGFAYATDEMLEDATFMSGFFGTAFSLATERLLSDAVISGDGAGKPLGLLKSGALITVAKETSQAANTLLGANVVNMWQRALINNRSNMVWLMHPDLESELPKLSISDGTNSKFLWNPEGGLRALDYQTLLNRPIIFDDNCSALGSAGDILLVDPFEYMLLQKGTSKQEWSIHVAWLTDQNCFRVVFRCNGAPKRNSAITIKNSTKTRSPYVTLAARA